MSSEKGGDDLVRGQELETPRMKAEGAVFSLLDLATQAVRQILTVDAEAMEHTAQSAALRIKLEAAVHVIDGCLGMTQTPGATDKRSAKALMAVMGRGAVNAELMRRYAQKQQTQREKDRARNAVPAIVEAKDTAQGTGQQPQQHSAQTAVDATFPPPNFTSDLHSAHTAQGIGDSTAHPPTTSDSIDSDASDNAMHRDDSSDGVDNDTTDGGR
jgi:hypothetical protein